MQAASHTVLAGTHWLRIPRNKTAAMRILLETVQRGSTLHTYGTVRLAKALPFADKIARLYEANANANRRAHRKRTGLANTTLVIFPAEAAAEFHWWLLVTPGRGDVLRAEKLSDATARGEHLRWGTQYELLQLGARDGACTGRSWTWQLTKRANEEWKAQALEATRSTGNTAADIARALSTHSALMRMPGFRGIRQQLWALHGLMHEQWRLHHRTPCPLPEFALPYLDKSFTCYHRPEPLRLDVLVELMQQRAAALRTEAEADLSWQTSDALLE